MHITIRDTQVPVELSVDKLTLGDAETLEKICGAALQDIDYTRAGSVTALIFVAARKTFPDIKLQEIRDLPVGVINAAMADTTGPAADDDVDPGQVGPDPSQPAGSDTAPPAG